MQKRLSKGKKPDLNEIGSNIANLETNQELETKPDYGDKNLAAIELGHKGGLKGGCARAENIKAK